MAPRAKPVALVLSIVIVAATTVIVINQRHQGTPVLVVGDSMSALSATAMKSTGDNLGYAVSVDAVVGIKLAARLETLKDAASSGIQRVIVELGTNDVLTDTPVATLHGLIDQAVTTLQAVRCVVFVNVGVLTDVNGLAGQFNDHLRQDVSLHANEHEFDWSTMYQAHPDWSDGTVHLQSPYWPYYATSIMKAVHTECR